MGRGEMRFATVCLKSEIHMPKSEITIGLCVASEYDEIHQPNKRTWGQAREIGALFATHLVQMGPGKMRNCGMRKVKCGMEGAEWWVKCGMRKVSLASILGVLQHGDHPYVLKGAWEVQMHCLGY